MRPKDKEEQEFMERVPYAQAVGDLMYAMTSTRPDICHAVGLVSRYQSNPRRAHWQAIKRFLDISKAPKVWNYVLELVI